MTDRHGALLSTFATALRARTELRERLHAEGTDCYRLFHGVAEGRPGLTADRYGPLLLLQTFREPLARDDVEALAAAAREIAGAALLAVCNHRGPAPQPDFPFHEPDAAALAVHECREGGVRFAVQARHRGQDPWLFLDLRAGRRAVRALAPGRAVLNLFAYTCGAGVVAAVAGARRVVNVDFAASALAVGRDNAARNGIAGPGFELLQSDCIPVLRQLAGLPVQRRGRNVPYAKVARERFGLIVLDPPRWATGPFGAIDVVRDYPSLFKPALLALADGGHVVATNHVPAVSAEAFTDVLRRCAAKAGRPLRSLELLGPEADFPSPDGMPPLKVAVCGA